MDKVNNKKSPHLKGKLKKKPNRTKTQYSNMNLIHEPSTVLTLCKLDRVRVGLGSKPTGPNKIGLADKESEVRTSLKIRVFFFFKLKIWVDLPAKSIALFGYQVLVFIFIFSLPTRFGIFFWVLNYVFGPLFLHYFTIWFLTFQICQFSP